MSPKEAAQESAEGATFSGKTSQGFTDEERAAPCGHPSRTEAGIACAPTAG